MNTTRLSLPSGITLATTQTGSTPAQAVLVHGWTCRRSDWDPTLAALGEDFTLASIDLPGHGDSADQAIPRWQITDLGDVLADAVTTLTDAPVTLVGHSMGGAVALEAARKLDQLNGVVLVDTFVIPYGDLSEEQARETETPFIEDFPAAIGGLVDNFTAAGLDPAIKQRMKSEMSSANPAWMLPLWADLLRWNPEPAFADIDVPIHAINGDMIPEPARARCEGRVTEWRLDGAGHFPQAEMPERFQQTLAEVLNRS